MTRIAIIGDTHYGARGDQLAFLDLQKRFMEREFFPTLKREGIDTVIHLGDLVDRRKYINYQTLRRMKDDFLTPMSQIGDMKIVAGNHDIFFRNSMDISSLNELLGEYSFETFFKPQYTKIKNVPVFMVPWMTPEIKPIVSDMAKYGTSKYAFGHLELQGFIMNPGSVSEHGDDASMFSNFKKVFTGHFHTKSTISNIHYLGSPFHFTWGDWGDTRGFHIFDFKTSELTFYENPYSIFWQFEYDEDDLPAILPGVLESTYVKVVVKNKTRQNDFEDFLKKIEAHRPLDLKIVETPLMRLIDETFSGTETTPDIIRKYIEGIEGVNKPELEKLMLKLYNEALLLEI